MKKTVNVNGVVIKDSLRICPADTTAIGDSTICDGSGRIYDKDIVGALLLNQTFWWLVFAVVMLFGLISCYAGIKLLFNVEGPSWHPGMILFILWIVSILGLGAFCVVKLMSLL